MLVCQQVNQSWYGHLVKAYLAHADGSSTWSHARLLVVARLLKPKFLKTYSTSFVF